MISGIDVSIFSWKRFGNALRIPREMFQQLVATKYYHDQLESEAAVEDGETERGIHEYEE